MRRAVFLTVFGAAAAFLVPVPASALQGALSDQAAVSRDLGAAAFDLAARRTKARQHYAKKNRRYDWSYYPYWRPYQYRYWQFYYPYGGPLF
jgi:hypothetical protein